MSSKKVVVKQSLEELGALVSEIGKGDPQMTRTRQVTKEREFQGDVVKTRLKKAHSLCNNRKQYRTEDYHTCYSLLHQYETEDTLLIEDGVPTHIIRCVIFVNISPDRPLGFTTDYSNAHSLAKLPVHVGLFEHLFMSCKHGEDIPCSDCKKIERNTFSVGGVQNLIGLMKKAVKFSEIPTDAILYAERMVIPIDWKNSEHLIRIKGKVDPEMSNSVEIQLAAVLAHDKVTDIQKSIRDLRKRLEEIENNAKRQRGKEVTSTF